MTGRLLRGYDGKFTGFLHDDAGSSLVSDEHRKNITQFLHALRALDAELELLNVPEPIRIRATGGFALLALMEHQGITSHRDFCDKYPSIPEWEYPETHRSLRSWFETGERGTPEPEEDFDLSDFDFDGFDPEWD